MQNKLCSICPSDLSDLFNLSFLCLGPRLYCLSNSAISETPLLVRGRCRNTSLKTLMRILRFILIELLICLEQASRERTSNRHSINYACDIPGCPDHWSAQHFPQTTFPFVVVSIRLACLYSCTWRLRGFSFCTTILSQWVGCKQYLWGSVCLY